METKNVVFYSGDINAKHVCKCFITDDSYDVLKANCPIYKTGVKHGSALEPDSDFEFSSKVQVCADKDYNEYYLANHGGIKNILETNMAEISHVANGCPFNADTANYAPSIDKSAKAMVTNNKMVTVFNIRYAESVHCPCNLGVQAFCVFKKHCPVCKNNCLDGNPYVSQFYVSGNERNIDIVVDRDLFERDFVYLADKNAKTIQELAQRCKYYRNTKSK